MHTTTMLTTKLGKNVEKERATLTLFQLRNMLHKFLTHFLFLCSTELDGDIKHDITCEGLATFELKG